MTRLACMKQAQADRTVPRLPVPWKTGFAQEQREFTLNKAALLQLPHGRGLSIQCLNGRAWLTIAGELRDIVLEPGDSLALDRHASVVVSGLPEALVRVAKR